MNFAFTYSSLAICLALLTACGSAHTITTVNFGGLSSSCTTNCTIAAASAPLTSTSDRSGKVELQSDKAVVPLNDTFNVYIFNDSNEEATIDTSTLNLLGTSNGIPYLNGMGSVQSIGTCNQPLNPGDYCTVVLINNSNLAPPVQESIEVFAVVSVKYSGESAYIRESTSANNAADAVTSITLHGW